MNGPEHSLWPEVEALLDRTLHEVRLEAVVGMIRRSGARSVLELGCGAGRLLEKLLAVPQLERITGLDGCGAAVAVARKQFAGTAGEKLRLLHTDYLLKLPSMLPHDAVVLVETIEHLDPRRLSRLEATVFGELAARLVVVTTPNSEYNPLLGLHSGGFRDPDHRFEWGRARFRAWAQGIGRRNGYQVEVGGIGPCDASLGTPTQYAHFSAQSA